MGGGGEIVQGPMWSHPNNSRGAYHHHQQHSHQRPHQHQHLHQNPHHRHQQQQATGKERAEVEEEEEQEEESGADTYAEYKPVHVSFGSKHPDSIVETCCLAGVRPPEAKYRPRIVEMVEDRGGLSTLQFETLVYACQRFQHILPNGERAGFFVGDGPGVGKVRAGRKCTPSFLPRM